MSLEQFTAGTKAMTWCAMFGAAGLVLGQQDQAPDLGGLPAHWGASVYTALVGILLWALRQSITERAADNKEHAVQIEGFYKDINRVRQEQHDFLVQLFEHTILGRKRNDEAR